MWAAYAAQTPKPKRERWSRINPLTRLHAKVQAFSIGIDYAAHKRGKGMVVLNHSIGAAFQLKHAVLVNPLDINSVAEGIRQALNMSHPKRDWRWRAMLESVKSQDIFWWTEYFLRGLMMPPPTAHRRARKHLAASIPIDSRCRIGVSFKQIL